MQHHSKVEFVDALTKRIKQWVLDVLALCESLPATTTTRVINYQLIKSSTSTGANHRATRRARSQKEFFSKLSIAIEEADESQYWLELIEGKGIACNQSLLQNTLREIDEIIRILAKARNTASASK